jgi:hypothetical protein
MREKSVSPVAETLQHECMARVQSHNPNQRADMTSKSQARRNKRAQNKATPQEWPAVRDTAAIATQPTSRPTDERLARGHWTAPDSKGGAFVDMACDMIGRLMVSKQITQQQAESARHYQSVRAAALAELDLSTIKDSCDTSQGGFDTGDGNPAVSKAESDMRNKVGRISWVILGIECGKSADDKPFNLSALRNALDCLAA